MEIHSKMPTNKGVGCIDYTKHENLDQDHQITQIIGLSTGKGCLFYPSGIWSPAFGKCETRSSNWKTRLLAPAAFMAVVYRPERAASDRPTENRRQTELLRVRWIMFMGPDCKWRYFDEWQTNKDVSLYPNLTCQMQTRSIISDDMITCLNKYQSPCSTVQGHTWKLLYGHSTN
jgi:hypothetical protein